MEVEFGIFKTSIYHIFIETLDLRKVCAQFVPHKLTDDQKWFRIQHSKDNIKEVKKDKNLLYNLVTDDETGVINMI